MQIFCGSHCIFFNSAGIELSINACKVVILVIFVKFGVIRIGLIYIYIRCLVQNKQYQFKEHIIVCIHYTQKSSTFSDTGSTCLTKVVSGGFEGEGEPVLAGEGTLYGTLVLRTVLVPVDRVLRLVAHVF